MKFAVTNNPDQKRYELRIDADEIAAAYYRIDDGNIVLIHTEVPFEHAGEGFGKELAAGVFSLLRANRQKAILRCAFMGGYVARHPENLDLVAG